MLKKVGIAAALGLGLVALLLAPKDRSTAPLETVAPAEQPATELFDFSASTPLGTSQISQAIEGARADGKFLFLYFHEEDDFSQFLPILREAKSRLGDRAYFAEADVRNEAENLYVTRYGVRKTPYLLAIAPNGAVTAGFTRVATPADLDRALVSEAVAELTLAVQNRKVVFLVIGNNERIYFDQAVATADSSVALLEGIGQSIILDPYEPETRRILKNSRIEVDPDMTELLVVSPSGGVAGRFPGNATQRDLLDSFQRILAQNKGCGARTLTGGSPCEPGRGVSGARGCGAQASTLP